MRIHSRLLALLTLCSLSLPGVLAQRRHGNTSPSQPNCFDPASPREMRLWPGRAPGAIGDDPCRDIPYLQVFPAASPAPLNSAILILPGGGYDRLSDRKEQAPVAASFAHTLNVTAFVLYYRLVQSDGTYRYPVPMWDGQRALKLLRSHSRQLGLNPAHIALFGFSAGGHLASTLALHSATDFDLPVHDEVDAASGSPDLLALGYPVISMDPAQFAAPSSLHHLLNGYSGQQLDHLEHYLSGQQNITRKTPPVFLFESMDDQRISPQNSVLFAKALRDANIPADIHLFAHGIHGAGLAEGVPEEQAWPELFHHWLQSQGFLR